MGGLHRASNGRDRAYGGPEVKMQQLKMRLRAIANAILDQSIHAGNMTEQQAMDLMTKETFQEQGEATAEMEARPADFGAALHLLCRRH